MRSLQANRWGVVMGLVLTVADAGPRGAVHAAEDAERRVVVVMARGRTPLPAPDVARVQRSVSDALRAAGFSVVGAEDLRRAIAGRPELGDCDGGACAAEAARLTEAPFAAVVRLVSVRKLYAADVAIIGVRAGEVRELARERIECGAADLCAPLSETAAQAARTAGNKTLADRPTPRAPSAAVAAPAERANGVAGPNGSAARNGVPGGEAPAPGAAMPTPALQGAADASGGARDDLAASATERSVPDHGANGRLTFPSRLPLTLLAGGVAMLGTSAVLFAFDDQETSCDLGPEQLCRHRNDTTPFAVATGALGLALAGVGGFLWWQESGSQGRVAFGVGPQGIVARGRF